MIWYEEWLILEQKTASNFIRNNLISTLIHATPLFKTISLPDLGSPNSYYLTIVKNILRRLLDFGLVTGYFKKLGSLLYKNPIRQEDT